MKNNINGIRNHKKGFTLIELLLVIVIIGILAGIVIAIINPARMQRRSRESVLRANLDKVCTAMFACATLAGVPGSCDTATAGEVDADLVTLNGNGTTANAIPPYAVYSVALSGTTGVVATGTLPGSAATGGGGAKTATACSLSCIYNFTTGVGTPAAGTTADCY